MKYDALRYYEVLGLSPQAGFEQIKQSYRDLAKLWHPDHNKDETALENFQKISLAYELLKEEQTRLRYDLLSIIYDEKTFPEYETMVPFKDVDGDVNVRAFWIEKVRGLFYRTQASKELQILSKNRAVKVFAKVSVANWLLGWWGASAFYKNAKALWHNYHNAYSAQESFRVLVHNLVAYQKQEDLPKAVSSAICALPFADESEKLYLEKFIALANVRVGRLQKWNLTTLKLAQMIMPFALATLLSLWLAAGMVSNKTWKNWWGNSKEIAYYQEVNFTNQKRAVDDVVVGKVHSIPVDRSDLSRLYHLSRDVDVMYGPSDEFDILKRLKAKTTVRLTGYSPDNVWARVLIDNGEMGFVRMNVLAKGVGKEVPFGSSVYEK